MRIPQVFTLIRFYVDPKLRHTEKEVYKNKKFRILAEFYVGVDGFEPPTLCL